MFHVRESLAKQRRVDAATSTLSDQFHAPNTDYRESMWRAADAAGVRRQDIKITSVTIPAGSVAFHHQVN